MPASDHGRARKLWHACISLSPTQKSIRQRITAGLQACVGNRAFGIFVSRYAIHMDGANAAVIKVLTKFSCRNKCSKVQMGPITRSSLLCPPCRRSSIPNDGGGSPNKRQIRPYRGLNKGLFGLPPPPGPKNEVSHRSHWASRVASNTSTSQRRVHPSRRRGHFKFALSLRPDMIHTEIFGMSGSSVILAHSPLWGRQ